MGKTAKIVIDKNIGEFDEFAAMFGGEQPVFSSRDMRDFLDNNSDATELEVEIRSNGGSVTQGFEIYDMLTTSGKEITTIAYKANSIATVIFLAGNKRKISKNAQFVIHNPFIDPFALGFDGLTADDLLEISNEVRHSEEKIFNFYSEKLGLSEQLQNEIKDLMKQDSDLGSTKALQYGFATEVIESNTNSMQVVKSSAYTNKIAALLKDKQKTNNKMVTQDEFNKEIGGLKSILSEIKNLFSRKHVKNGVATLQDGSFMYFDGEAIAVGTAVFTDEAMTMPAEDGSYTASEGETIVVAGGMVTEIMPVVEDTETVDSLKAKVADLEAKIATSASEKEAAIEAAVAEVKNQFKEKFASMESKITALEGFVPGGNPNPKKDKRFVADATNDLTDEVQMRIAKIRAAREIGRVK